LFLTVNAEWRARYSAFLFCLPFAPLNTNTLKNLRVNIAAKRPTVARSMASNSIPADQNNYASEVYVGTDPEVREEETS